MPALFIIVARLHGNHFGTYRYETKSEAEDMLDCLQRIPGIKIDATVIPEWPNKKESFSPRRAKP
jgi:hypothetical protein